jgi:organic hydroperoxide reductase OsmC/OhrA
MPASSFYRCHTEWTGAAQGPTLDTKTFSRDLLVTFPGRPPIAGSSAPEYQGDPSRINPEELFTASLAACQMLTYLYGAARGGVKVVAYTDDSEGELAVKDGRLRMVRVTLRPTVTISADSDAAAALALVERAHHDCFIANSVTTEVVIEPQIVTQS